MSSARIEITENGPYQVQGPIALSDHVGNPVDVPEGNAVFLCRCGGSTTLPFCDGTHSRIGFQGARKAVQEEEQSA